jgi:TolB-like protein/tetratricopeptide (TPR) repeat protein
MGEVYRARDSRLGREVAIKVLPPDRTSNPTARRRFEQEARAVALLSHPNILSIHHFDTHDDISYAVTELLEGETLRDRIQRAKLQWREAVQIAAAVCDGLAAAHEKGIVHRDLKPSNIFLTSDGQVKILDFGLAQTAHAFDDNTDVKTAPGTVLGTLGYMSPEQLRGEPVDATTDIFSLGCVLYEMVAGRSPFSGAAVLRDAPPELPSTAPPALGRIIRRCLQKNRNERYHSARDLGLELRSLLRPPATGPRKPLLIVAIAVAAAVAIALALMLTRRSPAPPQREIRSILVLPFENESHDPGAEYLSDGIAEGLIGTLAELPNVRVVARTTAFHFKGKPVDLRQIRNQVDVDAVLAGRLLSQSNNIVVQADLIDADSGTELWGKRFHEQSTDMLNIEQEMVGRISEALRVRLTPAQQSRISTPSTRNPEAYKLYLQGRFYWNKRTPEGVRKSRDLFEQAIAIDPRFALAYSGLADAYNIGAEYRFLPRQEARARAEEAVRTALRLDPELAEAHASLGQVEGNRFQWDAAEKEFSRALEINPNYASALQWYSILLVARGRIDEAVTMIRKAEQVDPLSAVIVANVAGQLNVKGDYAGALAAAQKAAELDPGYAWIYFQMGAAYEGLGQVEKAAATYSRGADVPGPPGFREFFLARADAIVGNRARARQLAQALEKRSARGEVAPTCVAWAYSAVGDRDKAIDWLHRAFDARDGQVRGIGHPMLKELRGDPRYADLVRRLQRGLEE